MDDNRLDNRPSQIDSPRRRKPAQPADAVAWPAPRQDLCPPGGELSG